MGVQAKARPSLPLCRYADVADKGAALRGGGDGGGAAGFVAHARDNDAAARLCQHPIIVRRWVDDMAAVAFPGLASNPARTCHCCRPCPAGRCPCCLPCAGLMLPCCCRCAALGDDAKQPNARRGVRNWTLWGWFLRPSQKRTFGPLLLLDIPGFECGAAAGRRAGAGASKAK